jgi:fructose-1,6-bisphosphatase/inositol monophosphatase family enzyme
MADFDFQVEIDGDLIVVIDPVTGTTQFIRDLQTAPKRSRTVTLGI